MQRLGKYTSVTIEELLGNGVFCGSAPTLYNEDYRLARIRIESLWRWQSNDWEQIARKELDCENKSMCTTATVRVL
jgi:hypothetical protein